jgi:phage-related protein (TIGR01555 family)
MEAPAARGRGMRGVRADSWVNDLTGVGSFADKTVFGRFSTVRRVTDVELTNLYNGSPLAAKIVEKRPTEMFRRGYTLKCDDVDGSEVKDLQDYAEEELHLSAELLEATIFGQQYGGDLVVMGIDDGGMPDEPLDETRIKTFTFFNGSDRRFSYVMGYYVQPGPRFGRPSHYLTTNAIAGYTYGSGKNQQTRGRSVSSLERGGFYTAVLHESRCLRFEGVKTDVVTMQTLAGWTWSILQRVYDSMRKFEHSFDSARYLLSDASQAVMTLKGYIDAISAGKEDEIMTRMAIADRTRSVLRTLVIDEGEKFERTGTPFGGISDVLEQMKSILASDTGYPFTELFGKSASGLNAAAGADSETRKWYDQIGSDQTIKLAPQYTRAYRLLALSADCPVKLPRVGKTGKPLRWEIEFKPLFTPTDDEEAKTQLARAQRDALYLQGEVVSAEELALEVQDMYPHMDVEAREAAVKAGESFDPHANDPDPPPPVIVAPGGVPPGKPGAPAVPGAPAAGTQPPAKGKKPPPGKPVAKKPPPKGKK